RPTKARTTSKGVIPVLSRSRHFDPANARLHAQDEPWHSARRALPALPPFVPDLASAHLSHQSGGVWFRGERLTAFFSRFSSSRAISIPSSTTTAPMTNGQGLRIIIAKLGHMES